jgi:DNA-directed RNA polymerase subunit omega
MGPITTPTPHFRPGFLRGQAYSALAPNRVAWNRLHPNRLHPLSGTFILSAVFPFFPLLRCENPLFFPALVTDNILNAEFCKKALEKVGNPNVLINLVSRRVRQLNSGGGAISRPLIADVTGLGAADIALLEIVEEKIGWEMPELSDVEKPGGNPKKRKRH